MNCIFSVLKHVQFMERIMKSSDDIPSECPATKATATYRLLHIASKGRTQTFQVHVSENSAPFCNGDNKLTRGFET